MQKTKAWKKQIALFLTFILLLTMFPMSAFGADGEGEAPAGEKPTISVDFLGFADKNTEFGHGPSNVPVEKDRALGVEDGVFWIGISLDNLHNATFIREGGIRDLEIGFEYNPKYITPVSDLEYDPNGTNSVDAAKWLQLIKDYNLTNDTAVDNADRWSSANYEIDQEASIYSTQLDESYGREFPVADDWKMMFVTVARTSEITAEENEKNRFTGITDSEVDAGPHYILRAPFRLVDVPEGDTKPMVLRLSLGPSTLVMTSGMEGEIGYAWEKETRTEDIYNLKNIFTFNGDINLFQADGANNLNDMSMTHTLSGSTDEIANKLFRDEAMTIEGTFLPSVKEYYTTVGSTADKAFITLVGPVKEPGVTHRVASDADAETPCVATHDPIQSAWIAEIPLTDTVKDEAGFDDVVKITIAQEGTDALEYIVHIKKEDAEVPPTGEAKIVLHPGNSPYGLIERMAAEYHGEEGAWDADKIAAAKEEFNKGNKFVAGYVPDGGDSSVEYTTIAWDGENLDKVDQTLFAIIEETFNDPGFALTDSKGNIIELSENLTVTRKITWDVMTKSGQMGFYDSVQEDQIEISTLNGTLGENSVDLKGKNIKPGIYSIEYIYSDGTSTAKETRRLVILPHVGDVSMDNIANSLDSNAINQRNYIYDDTQADPTKSTADARVFYYRTADVTMDNIANSLDSNAINQRTIKEFYIALPAL